MATITYFPAPSGGGDIVSGGVAGGQTLNGGTGASETLTLSSTAHATKGKILFGASAYDENADNLGIGTTSPKLGSALTHCITLASTGGTPTGVEMKRSTATAASDVGVIDFYNGTTRVAEFEVIGDGATDSGAFLFWTQPTGGALTSRGKITSKGSWVTQGAAIATNATDGFLYVPTCAGTPTGVPTAQTGTVALVYDTTGNKLMIYNAAWKGGTAPGAWS